MRSDQPTRCPQALTSIAQRLRVEDRGTILALLAISGLVILGFMGLAIDLGFAYVSKAQI